MSLSHQNRWLRDQDRRDGAGRMGAGRGWRAQEPHTSLRPGLFRAITPILASPGGLPGEKDSVSISRWRGRCGAGDRCEGAGRGGCAGVRGGRSRQGGGLRGAGGAVRSGGSGSVPCSSRCACRSRQGRSEAPAGARSARLGARRVGAGRPGGRGERRGRRPRRGPRRRRLSKSVAKARTESELWKRNVDIPRFCPRPVSPRDAFATDSDTTPPRLAPGAPPAPQPAPGTPR